MSKTPGLITAGTHGSVLIPLLTNTGAVTAWCGFFDEMLRRVPFAAQFDCKFLLLLPNSTDFEHFIIGLFMTFSCRQTITLT